MKHNALAVHAAKHYLQYYAVALQDQDVQYIKILPLCKGTLHVPRILHFSAFHSIRTTCIARKEGHWKCCLPVWYRLNHLIDIMHDELVTHEKAICVQLIMLFSLHIF